MEDTLVSAIVELNEAKVIKLVKKELKAKKDPLAILEQVRTGVEKVGKLYEEGKYFIADLIMSGLIFKEVLKYIDFQADSNSPLSGIRVIFATVEEDIHDVGKNVTVSLFQSRGIQVTDLGVDVPVGKIISEIEKTNASILCLSGLITPSYKSMKRTVEVLKEKQLHGKVKVIIGGNVNEEVKDFVGADYWVSDCARGLEICEKIASEMKESE